MSFKKNKYTVIRQAISKDLAAFVANYFLMQKQVYNTCRNARYISPFEDIIGKYERKINAYGWLVIVVAAITPLPFSATCAVVGAVGFKRNRYLFYSLARFLRYAIYGFFIWLAHPF